MSSGSAGLANRRGCGVHCSTVFAVQHRVSAVKCNRERNKEGNKERTTNRGNKQQR